jgi:hypothetical protein
MRARMSAGAGGQVSFTALRSSDTDTSQQARRYGDARKSGAQVEERPRRTGHAERLREPKCHPGPSARPTCPGLPEPAPWSSQ